MRKTYEIIINFEASAAVPVSATYNSPWQEMIRACTARLTASATSRKLGATVDLVSISSTEA